MTFSLKQDVFYDALQKVIGVVETNKTIPIVANVHIAISDSMMSITATDLGIEITALSPLAAATNHEIAITLPGKKIFDICKSLPQQADIEFIQKQNKMLVQYGVDCRFTIATLPANEFPSIDLTDRQASFSIQQKTLKTLLQRTVFAMAHQDVRYYLNGMLLEFNPDSLRAVATDGHRLATNSAEITLETQHKLQSIVPRKAVIELIKLLDHTESPVVVEICNNFICVSNDRFIFKTKLIEGRFPDYERVIPFDNDKVLTLNKAELKSILSRSAIMCSDAYKGVTFDIQSNQMIISSQNPDNQAVEQKIPIEPQDDLFSISFNVNYLLENLNVITTEEVALKLANQDKSMLITEIDSNDDSTFVIMPMRV